QAGRRLAPEEGPVRSDASSVAARAADGLERKADAAQVSDGFWTTPTAMLEAWEAGRVKLYWPTYFTVRELRGCASTEELLAMKIETREPDDEELEYLHRSTFWQE